MFENRCYIHPQMILFVKTRNQNKVNISTAWPLEQVKTKGNVFDFLIRQKHFLSKNTVLNICGPKKSFFCKCVKYLFRMWTRICEGTTSDLTSLVPTHVTRDTCKCKGVRVGPKLIKRITRVTSTVPLFTIASVLVFCWIPTTTNVIFWFFNCCFAFLCCVFERLWSHVRDGVQDDVPLQGGRAGLTCPTQCAAQLPSRPEDTLQARTLGTVQKFCKQWTFF